MRSIRGAKPGLAAWTWPQSSVLKFGTGALCICWIRPGYLHNRILAKAIMQYHTLHSPGLLWPPPGLWRSKKQGRLAAASQKPSKCNRSVGPSTTTRQEQDWRYLRCISDSVEHCAAALLLCHLKRLGGHPHMQIRQCLVLSLATKLN